MRYIKTIDDITKDGRVDFGPGYEIVERAEGADAILMRSTDLHGATSCPRASAPSGAAGRA